MTPSLATSKRKGIWVRTAHIEQLEPRIALNGEGALLGTDAHLTLSFAPDGTDVAGESNSLFATFNAIAPEAEWKEAILQAFQTWAVNTNADVGVVSDSGDAFGTPGAIRRDDRFGDIRIAAIDMEPEVGAISVPIDNVLSGSWYADGIFNSAFNYQFLNDIFAIAMHEAGNVFGLEDNEDPNSPLKSGPIPTATVPTATDIANLQDLHGVRAPDSNEIDDGAPDPNDTLLTATTVEFGEAVEDVTGSAPALIYGDLQTTTDVDFFSLTIPVNYTGGLQIQTRSDGQSLLKPTVTLFDSTQTPIAIGSSLGTTGNLVELNAISVDPGTTYYVKVESASTDVFGVGGYSMVAILDGLNTVAQEEIDAAANGSLRFLDADELEDIFDEDDDFFNEDLGTNDSAQTATVLDPSAGFADGTRFESTGSISTVGDLDFYRLTAPDLGQQSVMYVAIRSLVSGRLIPSATVLDVNEQVLTSRVLVNGAGEFL
ncbi:MAG: hypothetical protein MI725_01005, partial [Pirellulales bacterium]|nr:hypothetical protein [Pirellulales bacterium]